MNILMIHPHDIWADEEPWTSRIRNCARELVHQGHAVHVLYFAYVGREDEPPREDVFASTVLRRSKKSFFSNLQQVCREAAWADIIHVQKAFPYAAFPALFAHVLCNKPLHYDWDDWEWEIYKAGSFEKSVAWYLNFFENRLPQLADTVSVASRGLKKRAEACGVFSERMFDSHVCVDVDSFATADGARIREELGSGRPLVMYVGQLHNAQYVPLFIDAATEIVDRTEAHFVIVGCGEQQAELMQYVADRGIADRVTFAGSVPYSVIPEYVAAADVAVACFEDTPLVRCKSPLKVVEYMAAGKAIVASAVGDVPYMLGDAAVLVEPGSASALAEGVLALLNDDARRVTLGERAQQRAREEFEWSVMARYLLRAYKKACSLYK